jgi:hypothetical protein
MLVLKRRGFKVVYRMHVCESRIPYWEFKANTSNASGLASYTEIGVR